MKRILTAILLLPFILYVVLWGPEYLFLAVLITVAVLCFREYSDLVAAHGTERPGPLGYAAGLLVLLVPGDPFLLLTLAALAGLALALTAKAFAAGLPRAAALVLGIAYVFGSWRFAAGLHVKSPHLLLFALALNWAGDSAAYYAGRAFGRHKLAPRISPGKSWEGSIASVAASLLFGVLYLGAVLPEIPVAKVLVLSGAANVAGQLGDLAESSLKRGAGVKDSGTMLPGHGGWLDRVDSTLFAVPVVYALLQLPW